MSREDTIISNPILENGGSLIICRVKIPDCLFSHGQGFVSIHALTTQLLAECVRLDFQLNGQECKATSAGTFNNAILSVSVWDIHASLPVIHQLLGRLNLTVFTSVYWYDDREAFLRPVCFGLWDSPENKLTIEKLDAELEDLKRQSLAEKEATKRFLDSQRPAHPPNENP